MAVSFRVPKAAELVAAQLRNNIIRGELEENSTLPREAELVEQFGLSRPTVREAIRILESEGLISISRGSRSGAKINRPRIEFASHYFGLILQSNEVTIRDIYEARMVIEPPATEILARERDPEKVKILSDLIEECAANIDNNATYGELTATFHQRIVDLAGIKTLALLNSLLHNVLAKSNAYVWSTEGARKDTKVRKQSSIKARRALVELIAEGKAEEAREYSLVSLRNIVGIFDKWGASGRTVDVL